jgi:GTP-binding protein
MNNNKLPQVALIGRTNVGKSTLFNCLGGKRQALVSDIENTTRDSNRGPVEWNGFDFELLDTAGIIDVGYLLDNKKSLAEESPLEALDRKTQDLLRDFFKSVEVLLLVVDNKTGLLPQDKEIAAYLKKRPELLKKTMLVVNKVDNMSRQSANAAEFNRLGLGEPYLVSAASGAGTGDLLDTVNIRLFGKSQNPEAIAKPESKTAPVPDDVISVCIIGKPNVGKSSLLNKLVGFERTIVSPVAHTTREPQDTELEYKGHKIRIVDTAGISKHGHKAERLEKYGIQKSLQVLTRADMAILVLDINEPLTHQDCKIVEEISDRRKSLILIANKWDLAEVRDMKKYTDEIYGKLPFAQWAPLHFISASSGEKVQKILDMILEVAAARRIELSPSQLEHFLAKIVKIHKPAKGKGVKHPHIFSLLQTAVNPPRFNIRIGAGDDLHFSYVRFVENRLREQFGFYGTPLHMVVEKNKKVHSIRS